VFLLSSVQGDHLTGKPRNWGKVRESKIGEGKWTKSGFGKGRKKHGVFFPVY